MNFDERADHAEIEQMALQAISREASTAEAEAEDARRLLERLSVHTTPTGEQGRLYNGLVETSKRV